MEDGYYSAEERDEAFEIALDLFRALRRMNGVEPLAYQFDHQEGPKKGRPMAYKAVHEALVESLEVAMNTTDLTVVNDVITHGYDSDLQEAREYVERMRFDYFVDGYVACALWSTSDNHDGNLDDHFDADDIHADDMKVIRDECRDFIALCERVQGEDEEDGKPGSILDGWDISQAGHDFWLTRNGHGAGFWDRGRGAQGDELTKWAKTYGEASFYVGDDNTTVHYFNG